MAGITPTMSNLGIMIGTLYPLFIVSFLVLASIFNWKLTGLVYLGGVVFTYFISYAIALTGIVSDRPPDASVTCDIFSKFSYNSAGPSFQAAVCWFSFIYLLLPQLMGNFINPMVIFVTALFAFINMIVQYQHKCSNIVGLVLGAVLGLACGLLWFFIWWSSGKKDLLFYHEIMSNNAICQRPSSQTFKCKVYRGGELIGEI